MISDILYLGSSLFLFLSVYFTMKRIKSLEEDFLKHQFQVDSFANIIGQDMAQRIKDLDEFKTNVGQNLGAMMKLHNESRQRFSNKIELLESEIRAIHNLIGTAPGQPLSPEEVRKLFQKAINDEDNVENLEPRKRVRSRVPKRQKLLPNQDNSSES
jgi:hypothetical protein